MPRKRMIDPGIWQSGHFKRLDYRQRLHLIGLFSNADDEGKLKGEPAVIRAQIFPYDDERVKLGQIESDLSTFEKEGLIEQYEVAGDRYIRIVKWAKYQKPSHPTPSKIPNPVDASGSSPETLANSSGHAPAQGSVGQDSQAECSEGKTTSTTKPTNWGKETLKQLR